MRCDAVRDRLADHLTGRTGGWARARLRRHVDGCEACASVLREEEALQARLEGWADEEVPEGVWLRIRDSAVPFVDEQPPPGWMSRLRATFVRFGLPYALGAATTALLVLAFTGGSPDSRGDRAPTDPTPRWASDVAPALEPGEESLVLERPEDGILIIRDPSYRRLLERLRKEGLRPQAEEPAPTAQPASFGTRTH